MLRGNTVIVNNLTLNSICKLGSFCILYFKMFKVCIVELNEFICVLGRTYFA